MPRYRLTLEYDGGPFAGFQAQGEQPTVQAALEAAVVGFSGETVRIHAAGRTDAGVHALAQVAHFDLARDWRCETVGRALNAHVAPAPIAVLRAERAAADFHARFSAIARHYLFRILDRAAPPALDRGRLWWLRRGLDAEAMALAAGALVGRHDFTTFRDAACQSASAVKTLDEARIWREGEEVRLAFSARSFLHRQVRSMVGSLVQVGLGRWPIESIGEVLEARDRRRCGPVAPAEGLYLARVDYPAISSGSAAK